MRSVTIRLWQAVLVGAVLALVAGLALAKCDTGRPGSPFIQSASVTAVHRVPPPFVFWFTEVPKRLEPFECVVVPEFSRLFQGLQVRVCVPYFLNGYPARSYRP